MIAIKENNKSVNQPAASRCTLCPAGCELEVTPIGPDMWRSEYSLADGGGVCPRGSTMGELVGHRNRILMPSKRIKGQLRQVEMSDAIGEILSAASGKGITILLDANIPCEQIKEAARWCDAWEDTELCLVMEPAEQDMLLGLEASGAEYLTSEALAECDGFVIIGDAFSANPICARGVFDRRRNELRTPIVVIDPAGGTAAKFATHLVETSAGAELQALAAVATAAGTKVDACCKASSAEIPSAVSAGEAISKCKRLGVLIAAEHGRSAAWQQIGYLAGQLAKALGGAVAPQTVGANALAALRLGEKLGAVSLASAMTAKNRLLLAIGCDVLGMLAASDQEIFAAAAALPNCTTDQAQIVLPLPLPVEMSGTYILEGNNSVEVSSLLPAPTGVPTLAEIVAAIASAAGVAKAEGSKDADPSQRLKAKKPPSAPAVANISALALLLGRQAAHSGCGALTGHGSWQNTTEPLPILRVSPDDLEQLGLRNLGIVTVTASKNSICASVQVAPQLSAGLVVLPEGLPQARAMTCCKIDKNNDTVVATPSTVTVSK